MRRLVALAAVLTAGPARADYPPGPDKDGVVRIALDLSPAKTPVPVSRLNVYPEYRDQQPGNRVQGLLRTFMEQTSFFVTDKERIEKRNKWSTTPLADLPADVRVQGGVARGMMYDKNTAFLGIADRAARFDRVEWNEYFDLRKDGAFLVLPEVQKLRELAATFSLRMRGEVKAGEWERAVESAKTQFGMAQAVERHPTLISNLVGIAIAQFGLNALEEFVGQPAAPSLYWALTDIPTPPVNTRYGLGGERVFLTAQFQPLLDARRSLSPAELAPYLSILTELANVPGLTDEDLRKTPQYVQLDKDPAGFYAGTVGGDKRPAARQRLLARGYPAAVVDALPTAQLGLVNDLLLYEELRDELFKWYNLSHWQAVPGMLAVEERMKGGDRDSVLLPLFIATAHKVKSAETRLAQRVALLRAVEAVRLHAGATSQLPATLAATELPEPTDPVTGKPFAYSVKDGVATLRGENPQAPDAKPFVVEYTLRLRP